MKAPIHNFYGKYCLGLIGKALQAAVGHPPNVVTDAGLFSQVVIEPGWKSLPLPLRIFGRDGARWDEFLLQARKEVYTAAGGTVALRPDAPARLSALVERMFGAAGGGAAGAAVPVARPVDTAKKPATPPPAAATAQAVPLARPVERAKQSASPAPPAAPAAVPLARPVEPAKKPVAPPTPAARAAAPLPSVTATTVPPTTADGESEAVLGIDLGTTYSVIAHLDAHGRPVSIPNAAGELITPSVVLFEESGPVVGREAVMASAMEPEKIAECVKRDMGSREYRKKINGEFLPPEVISSLILRSLKADAERKLGAVRKAVITVPAYFDESRRQATIDAGKLAGLEVLDIINEPTAAAIAYGYQIGFLDPRCRATGAKPLRVLVYDLGGGTFDVTIVEIKGNSFRALATDGDVQLGGKDWDEKIVEIGAQAFAEQHREDPRSHPSSNQELWLAAEVAKKTLTERPKATLYVNHLGTRHKVEITRQEFEEATAPLLGRTRTTTEIVVRQSGLKWADLDKILLVGGSTRMPMVMRMLEDISGKPPERSVSPDEAVSHGAALYADLLARQQGKGAGPAKFTVTNISSHSLGIVGVDQQTGRKRNQVLIPKNTPLPHAVSGTFKTHRANQANVTIRIVEGESERPEACMQVGVCTITGLPADLPAGWPVQVKYSYESDGRLHVTARLKGQEAGVATVFERQNRLTDEEIQLWSEYVAQTASSGE